MLSTKDTWGMPAISGDKILSQYTTLGDPVHLGISDLDLWLRLTTNK
jgi:hypothetical protein